jgi:hypothetical protein
VGLVKLFVLALYILGYLDIEIGYLDLDGYLSECLLNVGLDGGDYK